MNPSFELHVHSLMTLERIKKCESAFERRQPLPFEFPGYMLEPYRFADIFSKEDKSVIALLEYGAEIILTPKSELIGTISTSQVFQAYAKNLKSIQILKIPHN